MVLPVFGSRQRVATHALRLHCGNTLRVFRPSPNKCTCRVRLLLESLEVFDEDEEVMFQFS